MTEKITLIRQRIMAEFLPAVPFDGWTESALETACVAAGYPADMAAAVFPGGIEDVVDYFADMMDGQMREILDKKAASNLKIREKIYAAVAARLTALTPYKEAERLALSFWARPMRKFRGAKILWRTADVIWTWAGDTSTDYNHYTKRALLSGVIGSTMLFWINDSSPGSVQTLSFLGRRIENVMQFGTVVGKFKPSNKKAR